MIRNIIIFIATFAAGALIALVIRTAKFDPHSDQAASATAAKEYAPLVSNALTPARADAGHAQHGAPSPAPVAKAATGKTAAAATSGATVNTVCAICGMAVDPKLPTLEYQGQKIGFGCTMCAPKFKADPDRYGPAYLRNEVIKK